MHFLIYRFNDWDYLYKIRTIELGNTLEYVIKHLKNKKRAVSLNITLYNQYTLIKKTIHVIETF